MKSKRAWPQQNIFMRDASPPNGRIKRTEAGLTLDSAAIDRYMRHGWVAVRGFFSAAQIADIQRFTEETLALPEISGAQMVYRETSLLDPNARVIQRIEDLCPHHQGFDRLIRGGRLQQ
jgi:2-aminoethylphosphonate dioxygenase